MRAFLSHSSKDKGFVEDVAGLLKPGTFELDSETFDRGLINAEAIANALRKSNLFCLFLSKESVTSAYVNFETLLGLEFFARGKLAHFLVICLDDTSFDSAAANIRFFNIVRKSGSAESCARLIQGTLISASSSSALAAHPFVDREEPLKELERQAFSTDRPPPKALFVSGNFGTGRRSLVRKFFQNQYPEVSQIFPSIEVPEFSGLAELHRRVVTSLRPTMRAKELATRVTAFDAATPDEQRRQIAEMINAVVAARETVLVVDTGGMLVDSGEFDPEIDAVISRLVHKPHPPAAFIATRMIPARLRRDENDVAYVALRSLDHDNSERLSKRLMTDRQITFTAEQLSELIRLADGHPFNFYRMVDEIGERGISAFLANPSDFIEWKHRQSSDYLGRIQLDQTGEKLLGLLTLVPSLDFQAIVEALELEAPVASDSLLHLAGMHVIEHSNDVFAISPPLRVAVERDRRIKLEGETRTRALAILAKTLAIRLDEGSARIDLVDSAVLSAIESGELRGALIPAFLLPSHFVWLAKRNYDNGQYAESIRLAQEALKSPSRLSNSGLVAACRVMCLAAARIGDTTIFDNGIARLQSQARDDWARSNIAFLRGFNTRFLGNLPLAEESFREAYRLSPGNTSAARELASICLARGNLVEAETFAREVYQQASRNPYVIDVLIAVLIKKLGRRAAHDLEVVQMLDDLESVGEEGGHSFFTTRKAELEHLWGDNRLALQLIEKAIARTPNIFEPRRLYVEILLKEGNKARAGEAIGWMRDRVNARQESERRSNYRSYLETYSHYLTEVGRFEDAKELFNDSSVFSDEEAAAGIRKIEIAQSFRSRDQR